MAMAVLPGWFLSKRKRERDIHVWYLGEYNCAKDNVLSLYMPFIYLFFVFKLVLAIDKNYCCSQHTLKSVALM